MPPAATNSLSAFMSAASASCTSRALRRLLYATPASIRTASNPAMTPAIAAAGRLELAEVPSSLPELAPDVMFRHTSPST